MKLTITERWMLSNQYRILKGIATTQDTAYDHALEVLEFGYELEYDSLIPHIFTEVLTEDECHEVLDIMSMFSILMYTYAKLDDKTGVESHWVMFRGFDGNQETKQMAYAKWLRRDSRFTDLGNEASFNSHFPLLDRYRQMLYVWRSMHKKYELTREEILQITSACDRLVE